MGASPLRIMNLNRLFPFALLLVFLAPAASPQDWIRTGTGLGVEKIRLAVPEFRAPAGTGGSATLVQAFNETLWNDLEQAGIFEMVSKKIGRAHV